jgi:uncharacterized protein YrrD
MKVPQPENEEPIAWPAILSDTLVYASDGQEVGAISDVLGSQEEDIFHGIVVRTGALSHETMIPAAHVSRITSRRIDVDLSSDEVRALPHYVEEQTYHLGIVGLFRKRLGWVPDKHDAPE